MALEVFCEVGDARTTIVPVSEVDSVRQHSENLNNRSNLSGKEGESLSTLGECSQLPLLISCMQFTSIAQEMDERRSRGVASQCR